MMLTTGEDATSTEWKEIARIALGGPVIKSTARFHPTKREWQLFCSTFDGTIHQIACDNTFASKMVIDKSSAGGMVNSLQASDGDSVLVGRGNVIEMWSNYVLSWTKQSVNGRCLACFLGNDMVITSSGASVSVWDSNNSTLLEEYHLNALVLNLASNADGTRFMAHTSNSLCVWEATPTLKLVFDLANSTKMFGCAALGNDRALLGCDDGNCVVINFDDNAKEITLFGHYKNVRSVQLFCCGTRGVSASWDGSVRVWDLIGNVCLTHLSDLHTQYITSITLLGRDESFMLTTSSDKTCKMVDLHHANRQRLLVLLHFQPTLPTDIAHVIKMMLF